MLSGWRSWTIWRKQSRLKVASVCSMMNCFSLLRPERRVCHTSMMYASCVLPMLSSMAAWRWRTAKSVRYRVHSSFLFLIKLRATVASGKDVGSYKYCAHMYKHIHVHTHINTHTHTHTHTHGKLNTHKHNVLGEGEGGGRGGGKGIKAEAEGEGRGRRRGGGGRGEGEVDLTTNRHIHVYGTVHTCIHLNVVRHD